MNVYIQSTVTDSHSFRTDFIQINLILSYSLRTLVIIKVLNNPRIKNKGKTEIEIYVIPIMNVAENCWWSISRFKYDIYILSVWKGK